MAATVNNFDEAKAALVEWLKSHAYFEVTLSDYQVREPMHGGIFQINLSRPFGVVRVTPDGKVIDVWGSLTK